MIALEKKQPHFRTKKVVVITGGHFVHDVFSSFLAPFLPLLIGKFQLSMVLAGSVPFSRMELKIADLVPRKSTRIVLVDGGSTDKSRMAGREQNDCPVLDILIFR